MSGPRLRSTPDVPGADVSGAPADHARPAGIDVRGPRFGASITTIVLATALIAGVDWLVAVQTAVFAVGALAGLRYAPYGVVFRFLRRRLDLGAPPELEPEGPPRFAQLCGLVVAGGATAALASGAQTLGWVLTGVVLALSSLLALTGVCVGCELYLAGRRLRHRVATNPDGPGPT